MSNAPVAHTWVSPREHAVNPVEQEAISRLVARDTEIGAAAGAKYGRGTIAKRPIPVRVLRRMVFEVKKLVGPAAKRVLRASSRRWYRYVADRSRIANGSTLSGNSVVIEVRSLSEGSNGLSALLQHTTATHWVLTREPGQLLRSATAGLLSALSDSSSQMWFGDSRGPSGVRERRPAFSRLVLRQVDALGPVIVVRTDLLRASLDVHDLPAELWPLALGLRIPADQVQLIPEVLGVGAVTNPVSQPAGGQAIELVEAELAASNLSAQVSSSGRGRRDVRYAVTDTPLVSIVIPTRGSSHNGQPLVVGAVESILERSSYSNIQLVIVADDPTPQHVVDAIDALAGDKVVWVRWSAPFNFSSKMNLGAVCATGEYLLFLNDDVEVVSPDWIERMLSLIGVDGIGYTGALLFFEDATIQHAGHFYAGGAGHIGFQRALRLDDPAQSMSLDRPVSGLTAACSLIAANKFAELGGFSEVFPGNYNDVDLCMKVREAGMLSAVAGGSRLYHFESKTRDATVSRGELLALHERWYGAIQSDQWHREFEGL